jgi:hypothetical protein
MFSRSLDWGGKDSFFFRYIPRKKSLFFELLFTFITHYLGSESSVFKGLVVFQFVVERCLIAGANIELFSG